MTPAFAAAAVAILLALTGCGQPIAKPVLIVRDPPPVELTDCQPEPEWPDGGFQDEAARYQWSAAAIYSGRDCRARLGALKAWALAPPR